MSADNLKSVPFDSPTPLTAAQRYIVLAAAFLGWMFAGLEMNVIPIAGRPAIKSFLSEQATPEQTLSEAQVGKQIGKWFSRYICAFLLGAALGGLIFGWMGDHIGRSKAMALSILCYSLVTGATYFAQSLEQVLVLRFVACMGIGGMWPNGVALAAEAWSEGSRPLLAGLIGTAANVGFVVLAVIAKYRPVTPDDWRWITLVGGTPVLLGLADWFIVPESPHWLARRKTRGETKHSTPIVAVFKPPYLSLTIVGILLGTIPLLGGWGTLNWIIPWADKIGGDDNPGLKATVSIYRSSGAAVGSLIGGWLASRFGRRSTYFTISLLSLGFSGYIFWFITPESGTFLLWVCALGFVATTFFGWLPLYLPELFPTAIRATGSGVTFNFGRIIAAAGVLGTGMLVSAFNEDYARVGRITHLIYLLGMLVILFAPDTTGKRFED